MKRSGGMGGGEGKRSAIYLVYIYFKARPLFFPFKELSRATGVHFSDILSILTDCRYCIIVERNITRENRGSSRKREIIYRKFVLSFICRNSFDKHARALIKLRGLLGMAERCMNNAGNNDPLSYYRRRCLSVYSSRCARYLSSRANKTYLRTIYNVVVRPHYAFCI